MTLIAEHIEGDTRDRILEVAERLFRQVGYQKIGKIAQEEPRQRLSLLRIQEGDSPGGGAGPDGRGRARGAADRGAARSGTPALPRTARTIHRMRRSHAGLAPYRWW